MNHSFVNWKIYFSNKDKNNLIRINTDITNIYL